MDSTLSKERRSEALDHYRVLLGSLERHADATRRSVIHVGEETLALDPWVRSHVLGGLGFRNSSEDWEALLTDGVACCARSLHDLQLAGTGGDLEPSAREALILDSALCMCLLEESADAVSRLEDEGRTAQAEGLGRFREQMSEIVERVRARLDDEAIEGAREQIDLSHVPTPEMLVRPKQKSHTGALLVALFVAAACWGGVTWWDHTRKAPSTPMLTLQDFGPAPGVTDVAARPPRVFLYMEATTWRGMVAADREALLVRLGEVASGAGYTGVHLNTPEGSPLGMWGVDRGVELLDRTEASRAPAPGGE